MGDRDAVLDAIPRSVGGEAPVASIRVKTVPLGDLWAAFLDMVAFHNGEVGSIEGLSGFADSCFWDGDVPAFIQEKLGKPVQNVRDAHCGVTLCDVAIAETGSLLLAAGPGRRRLASLVPPIHIALVSPGSVVASLEEGLQRLADRSSVLITGPSRTADVEGVIVMGVHGPKRLIVVPLPE